MTELTIEEMRAKVMAADAAAMEEQNAQRAALMKPLNDFITSKELFKVKQDVEQLAIDFAQDPVWKHKFRAIQGALELI